MNESCAKCGGRLKAVGVNGCKECEKCKSWFDMFGAEVHDPAYATGIVSGTGIPWGADPGKMKS